jgi:hypothetical protein
MGYNPGMNNLTGLPRPKVQLYTINPIEPADVSQLEPEFCRLNDLRKLFGITRSYAYILMSERKIQTISLRRPGQKFSVRLVYVASVRQYLHSLLEAQSNQQETADE